MEGGKGVKGGRRKSECRPTEGWRRGNFAAEKQERRNGKRTVGKRERRKAKAGRGGGESRWKGRGGGKSGLEGARNFAAEKPRGAELSRETTRRGLNEVEAERRKVEADAKAGYVDILGKSLYLPDFHYFMLIFIPFTKF